MVNDTLRRLVTDLEAHGIDYSVIQELIRVKRLDARIAETLDPSVREKYLELYNEVAQAQLEELSAPEESPESEREGDEP